MVKQATQQKARACWQARSSCDDDNQAHCGPNNPNDMPCCHCTRGSMGSITTQHNSKAHAWQTQVSICVALWIRLRQPGNRVHGEKGGARGGWRGGPQLVCSTLSSAHAKPLSSPLKPTNTELHTGLAQRRPTKSTFRSRVAGGSPWCLCTEDPLQSMCASGGLSSKPFPLAPTPQHHKPQAPHPRNSWTVLIIKTQTLKETRVWAVVPWGPDPMTACCSLHARTCVADQLPSPYAQAVPPSHAVLSAGRTRQCTDYSMYVACVPHTRKCSTIEQMPSGIR